MAAAPLLTLGAIATRFAAMPRRTTVVVAKAVAVVVLVAATAVVAMPAALAITALTRSGVVPLIVLVANGSVVSVSFLLYKVTPLARYLPDLAGIRMAADSDRLAIDDALAPVPGGLVMAVWTAALLAVAAVVLARRDA